MRSLAARLVLLVVAALWCGGLVPAPAHAEEAPPVPAVVPSPGIEVPELAGRALDEARHALEVLGLQPVLVAVAGPAVGRVERQEPLAGARLAAGAPVVLRHGIALRVETRVPAVAGRLMAEVGADLESAYALDIEVVVDAARRDGEILELRPAAGEALWFRGVLALKVASAAAPALPTAAVPALVGLEEQEAVQLVISSGLRASVEVRRDPAQPAGRVISQEPASGAEMVAGGTVFLRVSGEPPAELPPELPVLVPALVGLEMNAALGSAQAQGFVPSLAFLAQPGATSWTVLAQEPAAGAAVRAGSVLTLTVALPAAQPAQVQLPSLFGLSESHALGLLQSLGLGASLVREPSGFPAGVVFAQGPAAGSLLPPGSLVALRVSAGGPPPVATAIVPSLVGLDPLEAWLKAVLAGFTPRGLKHLAPGLPADKVDAQSPAPGSVLPRGSELRFFTPLASRVPVLTGLSRGQAVAALEAAGFNAQPQGPHFGLGATLVTAQAVAAGTELARGTIVRFTFVFTVGDGLPVKVAVPSLLGLTKEQAAQALQGVGLGIRLLRQGPVLPGLGTKVVQQSPAPGTLWLAGSKVDVTYAEVLDAPPPGLVTVEVPSVLGLATAAAEERLVLSGLQVALERQGPPRAGTGTRVLSQSPAAGVRVLRGTLVRAVYEEVLLIVPPGPRVQVPDLGGLTQAQAAQRLPQRGREGQFVRPGAVLPGDGTRVTAQVPAAGTLVLHGSTVRVTFVEVVAPLEPPVLQRTVPDLVGMTREAVIQALQAVGLQAHLQHQGPVLPGDGTRVVSQVPAAGTQVFPGSTVRATYVEVLAPVVVPPLQAVVPQVTGLRLDAAREALEQAGLRVATSGPPGLPRDLRVVSQSLSASTRVPPGTTVRLTLVRVP